MTSEEGQKRLERQERRMRYEMVAYGAILFIVTFGVYEDIRSHYGIMDWLVGHASSAISWMNDTKGQIIRNVRR